MVKIADDYFEPEYIPERITKAIKRAYKAIPKTKSVINRTRRVRRALLRPSTRVYKVRMPRPVGRPRRAVGRPRKAVVVVKRPKLSEAEKRAKRNAYQRVRRAFLKSMKQAVY